MFFHCNPYWIDEFATLLPNYWLAETPQPLAARRLGRQSAERERISEINWNVF
ncbi:hypothetical protein J7J00_17070 [Bacillus sp. ISL-4]|uniref:hypothetical protein n=1 Tax=Bacillus sp. ISL-4 TaxID=2819125 RepID=UPI001BEA322C|nr:hypothetical protein [Bacillus sp. ISL-4]MBT2667203.1 hypothetical protein [Bacillus sp. ISL-4]